MPRLFTYTIPIDDGAAPNPFRGMCSLAICKPGIRRVAKRGDWVAGLGSKGAPSGDLSGRLVYAMCVEEVLSLKEYDEQAADRWPHRIPNLGSADLSERLGDCIYDYSRSGSLQRPGVHDSRNVETDLSGMNALLSWEFYYFGKSAIPLPDHLLHICHQTRGHRSDLNAPYLDSFVTWVHTLTLGMHGWPDYTIDWRSAVSCGCPSRMVDGETDSGC
jgi:Nucleotide modification associated domain 2